MILKIIFIINLFLNFNFAFLISSDTEIYYKKVVLRNNNENDHNICYFDVRQWGNLCRRVIQHLRQHHHKYKHLYVNYPAFNYSSKCALRNVRLPQLPDPVKQNSLPCPTRPWMMPVEGQDLFLQDQHEIIIFPHLKGNLMIFSRVPNTNEYTVLEILRTFKWSSKRLPKYLFTTTIPAVEENIEVLYPYLRANCSKLHDESVNEHIIMNNLCKSILNSPKYDREIDRKNIITNGGCETVALHIPPDLNSNVLNCLIKACQCIGYHPDTKEEITAFSVASIKDHTSVILLKRTVFFIGGFQLYDVLEYLENVDSDYFLYYEYY